MNIKIRDESLKIETPYIISASRATDIPAFHGDWFFHRLHEGYCLRINPFNPRQKKYISFEKLKLVVFWTKNPEPIIPRLKELDKRNIRYYFQYSLNDYEKENLEPNLPRLNKRLASFKKLSEKIGKERVVWRFDPVIKGNKLTIDNILERIDCIGNNLSQYTEKLVFSRLSFYKKTISSLKKIDPSLGSLTDEKMREFAVKLCLIKNSWSNPLKIALCGDKLDLEEFGVFKNSCIDLNLIARICPEYKEIVASHMRPGSKAEELSLLGEGKGMELKDKGQRKSCNCAPSQDVGSYNSCAHFCVYCYANSSISQVRNNLLKVRPQNESLLL